LGTGALRQGGPGTTNLGHNLGNPRGFSGGCQNKGGSVAQKLGRRAKAQTQPKILDGAAEKGEKKTTRFQDLETGAGGTGSPRVGADSPTTHRGIKQSRVATGAGCSDNVFGRDSRKISIRDGKE